MYARQAEGERFVITLVTIFLFGLTSESLAMRYAPATISLDGKEVLKCGGGDDGSPDADEVWDTLKTRRFRHGEHFSALNIPANAQEFIIESDAPSGQPGTIVVNVSGGGKAQTRSLRIIRADGEWMIDPKAVDEMFEWRTITREQAADLNYPGKTERMIRNWLVPIVVGIFIGMMISIFWFRSPKRAIAPAE